MTTLSFALDALSIQVPAAVARVCSSKELSNGEKPPSAPRENTHARYLDISEVSYYILLDFSNESVSIYVNFHTKIFCFINAQ